MSRGVQRSRNEEICQAAGGGAGTGGSAGSDDPPSRRTSRSLIHTTGGLVQARMDSWRTWPASCPALVPLGLTESYVLTACGGGGGGGFSSSSSSAAVEQATTTAAAAAAAAAAGKKARRVIWSPMVLAREDAAAFIRLSMKLRPLLDKFLVVASLYAARYWSSSGIY